MTDNIRPRVLFVTTYDPNDESLGGASWVDRQLLIQLADACDVEVLTVASPGSPTDVPLEVRNNRNFAANTVWRMAHHGEAYQEAKFKWHKNWPAKVAEFDAASRKADIIITSQWPALLLCEDALARPDIHIAHNVDWVLAERFDPLPFRLASNAKKMRRRERALLGLPSTVLALSTTDVRRLADTGVFARHLPLFPSADFEGQTTNRKVGFIGKISWPPNKEAVDRLLDEVMPQVNARLNEPLTVVLAGSGTEQFAGRKDVEVLGRVENVKSFYNEIDLAAIPRGGEVTGISVKLIEAIEYGRTAVAPRQLADDAGIFGAGVLHADTADQMTDAIVAWYSASETVDNSTKIAPPTSSPLTSAINARWALKLDPRPSMASIPQARKLAADRCVADIDELLEAAFHSSKPMRAQTVNLHHAYLARTFPDFRDAISTADIVTADGWPIVEQFRIFNGKNDISRVTGSEFLTELMQDNRLEGKRVALVGGTATAAASLDSMLREKGAILAFSETGAKNTWEPHMIGKNISNAKCDIVLLAVTPPYGDLLAMELQRLSVPGFKISIGGGLEMLVGERKRAPRLIQTGRIEWLYRLAQDPKHLWQRYVVQCIPTYMSMLKERAKFS